MVNEVQVILCLIGCTNVLQFHHYGWSKTQLKIQQFNSSTIYYFPPLTPIS